MLNYISAEWYKLCRRKGIFIAFAVLLLLETSLFLPRVWDVEPTLEVCFAILSVTLPLGFFLAPIFAVRVFDDQYGRGTMKNEIVCGIPRSRVYLGKLTAAALTGTGAALIVLGWYLLLAVITCGLEGLWAKEYLQMMATYFFAALPLWLASLSFTFLLVSLIRNASVAVAVDYLLLVTGVPLSLMGLSEQGMHILLFRVLDKMFFASPLGVFYRGYGGGEAMGWNFVTCWIMGLAWGVITTAVGLLVLKRREI